MPSLESPEFKDDSQIIPRSSSVVVKRLPAARAGKGKASMYVSGASSGPTGQDSGPKSGPSSLPPTWNKGAMSKRFDGKDEATKTSSVSLFSLTRCQLIPPQSTATTSPMKSSITNDDEKAAVAAMFQAQTANWEETQEKMSQLVLPHAAFVVVVDFSLMNIAFFPSYFSLPCMLLVPPQCSTDLHQSSWYRFYTRGSQASPAYSPST